MKTHSGFQTLAVSLLAAAGLLASACGPAAGAGSEATDQGLVVLPEPGAAAAAHGPDEHDHAGEDHAPHDARPFFHDLGVVQDGDVASHTFRLRNSDRVPLTIQQVKASCGCTVPAVSWVDEAGVRHEGDPAAEPEILVVPPGAVVEVAVRVETHAIREKNRRKLMQVRVTSDSLNDPFLTLELSLAVEQAFRVEGDAMRIPPMARSAGGRGSVRVIQAGESGARVTGVGATPEQVHVTVTREDVVGRGVWLVEAEVLPPLEVGPFTAELELLTETKDGEPAPSYPVTLHSSVTPDLTLDPARVVLSDFRSDGLAESTTVLTCNVPGQRVRVLGADVQGDEREHVEVEWTPIEPDAAGRSASWTLRVRALPGIQTERFSGYVLVRLDDPQTPELKFVYAGV